MPNDAKLGLVVGLGLVITVAVVFFRKDLLTGKSYPDPAAASTGSPVKAPPPDTPRGTTRPARARTTSQSEAAPEEKPAGARQVLREDEPERP